jgi:hypothetical protein
MRRGLPLAVRFEDPHGLLPAPALGKAPAGQVMVGIVAPNTIFVPMPIRTRWPGAREHVISVPPDTPITVSINANGILLADGKGKSIDTGHGYQFPAKIAGDPTPSKFTFQITGKSK